MSSGFGANGHCTVLNHGSTCPGLSPSHGHCVMAFVIYISTFNSCSVSHHLVVIICYFGGGGREGVEILLVALLNDTSDCACLVDLQPPKET